MFPLVFGNRWTEHIYKLEVVPKHSKYASAQGCPKNRNSAQRPALRHVVLDASCTEEAKRECNEMMCLFQVVRRSSHQAEPGGSDRLLAAAQESFSVSAVRLRY